jgi:hypothetical protein
MGLLNSHEAQDRNTMMLNQEDSALVRYAAAEQDNGFIRNQRVIRENLLLHLANPNVAKPNYNKLAAQWGCKPATLKRMRGSLSFQSELASVIRDWSIQAGGGDLLYEAFLQLRRGVKAGKPWAVAAALRIGGVMGSKEVKDKPTPYEDAVNAAQE